MFTVHMEYALPSVNFQGKTKSCQESIPKLTAIVPGSPNNQTYPKMMNMNRSSPKHPCFDAGNTNNLSKATVYNVGLG